jgi:CRP-like cAMP-binding protein
MNLQNLFDRADDVREFTNGQTVFAEGDPGDVMYVVLAGELDVRVGGHTVYVARPGDIVGEMALIDSRPRSATVTARTDCRAAPVDQKRFLFLVQQTPFFAIHVMNVLAGRLRYMDSKTVAEQTEPAP